MAVTTNPSSFTHHKECIMHNHMLVTNGKCCVKCYNFKVKLSVSLTEQGIILEKYLTRLATI